MNEIPPPPVMRTREFAPWKEQAREAFYGSLVWLAKWGTRAAGLYIGYRLLAVLSVLLAGDPRGIREGADAGARALVYIRKAIAAGYLPSDETPTGQLPPKPSPSPDPTPTPAPSSTPAPAAKASK